MKTIEIEHRCLINLEQYDKLHEFLLCHSSQDLGEDDKNVFFFILPDKLLKVTHNISKETAKITLKLSKIGVSNDFEEIEIPINPIDIQLAVNIFKKLGFTQIQESFQKRHNFIYQWVEIALKHSKDRWHHVELEIIVDDLSKKEGAEKQIYDLAHELDLKIMSNEKLEEFTRKIDEGYDMI